MGKLHDILQRHMDAYGVREAALARLMGTSSTTINSWKTRGVRQVPARWLLEAVARETRTPYQEVLRAALADAGYLDDGVTPSSDGESTSPREPAASPPAEVHQPRPEDSVGVASRQGHAPSRSRVSGGRGTRPPHS
jgi:DNA-binding transcriptional regulator YdaS (Cro superfamily)